MNGIRITSILLLMTIVIVSGSTPVSGQQVISVDASATGANTGGSWADAFTDLQNALAAADMNGDASPDDEDTQMSIQALIAP